MSKRTTSDAAPQFDSDDRPIGLTGAFEPVNASRHARSNSYDSPVGLTQAFGPVPDVEEQPVNWDTPDKWKGFNWDDPVEPVGEFPDEQEEPAEPEPADEAAEQQEGAASSAAAAPSTGGRHARHAASPAQPTERMKQSHKLRRTLVVVIVFLLIAAGVGGYFVYRLLSEGDTSAAQHVQEQTEASSAEVISGDSQDVVETAVKVVDVPDLAGVLGMDKESAQKTIGHGALETGSREITDKDSVIKRTVTLSLTEEPIDSKTHSTPTVYLGLNEAGVVVEVGYSASAASLGYAYAPFADAVVNEKIIENTFEEIGVKLPEGAVVLPSNKDDYTTYASDGKTVTKERCPFVGDVDVNGTPCTWSAVLSYDYTTQMIRGDLTETVRLVYVYVTAK